MLALFSLLSVPVFSEDRDEQVESLMKNAKHYAYLESMPRKYKGPFSWWKKLGFATMGYGMYLFNTSHGFYPELSRVDVMGISLLATGLTLGLTLLVDKVYHRHRRIERAEQAIAELREELVRREARAISADVAKGAELLLDEMEDHGYKVKELPNFESAHRRAVVRRVTKWSLPLGLEAAGYASICAAGIKALGGF